jgi:hypothetical protein
MNCIKLWVITHNLKIDFECMSIWVPRLAWSASSPSHSNMRWNDWIILHRKIFSTLLVNNLNEK